MICELQGKLELQVQLHALDAPPIQACASFSNIHSVNLRVANSRHRILPVSL